jgi:hypothetical protein
VLCQPIGLDSVKNEWAKKAAVCGIFFLFGQIKNENHGGMRLCKGPAREKPPFGRKKKQYVAQQNAVI